MKQLCLRQIAGQHNIIRLNWPAPTLTPSLLPRTSNSNAWFSLTIATCALSQLPPGEPSSYLCQWSHLQNMKMMAPLADIGQLWTHIILFSLFTHQSRLFLTDTHGLVSRQGQSIHYVQQTYLPIELHYSLLVKPLYLNSSNKQF